MAIELTYGDDADQIDIDRAILRALHYKPGYVIRVTTEKGEEDVVVDAAPSGDTLFVRRYTEDGSATTTGPRFGIDVEDIHAIHVY